MDPIHFLACPMNPDSQVDKPDANEIEAFYERNGLMVLEVLLRWRSKLNCHRALMRGLVSRSANFAREALSS